MLLALCVALAVLVPAGASPVFPRPAHVIAIAHLPPDSLEHDEFLTGFHDAVAETLLDGLAYGAGATRRHAVSNRFAVDDGDAADDAWSVQVTLGLPPPSRVKKKERHRSSTTGQLEYETVEKSDLKRRATRGITVAIEIVAPGTRPDDPRPGPVRNQIVLPMIEEPGVSPTDVSSRGYLLSWTDAGRAAGLLVLEALHRSSGDLPDSLTLDVAPSVRVTTAR